MARQSIAAQMATLVERTDNIKETVESIEKKLEKDYVTQDQHELTKERISRIEKIVYGLVAIVLIALTTAIVNFFIPFNR